MIYIVIHSILIQIVAFIFRIFQINITRNQINSAQLFFLIILLKFICYYIGQNWDFFQVNINNIGQVHKTLFLPPDVKIETTFFRENFSSPHHAITLKNSTKKEPLISQKSLFYAVFLKFFHCQHRCLLHIKFHQIVL